MHILLYWKGVSQATHICTHTMIRADLDEWGYNIYKRCGVGESFASLNWKRECDISDEADQERDESKLSGERGVRGN